MVCKTPLAGQSKTRLSPPLTAEQCAGLSACFIRDVAATIDSLGAGVTGYAVYTPEGSEPALRELLPARLPPPAPRWRRPRRASHQGDGRPARRGPRRRGAGQLGRPHPAQLDPSRRAWTRCRRGDNVVLSPALDGGYTLIGLSRPHPEIFTGIPWSTADVYRMTLQRAAESALAVTNVPPWYDIDDLASLRVLQAELGGSAAAVRDAGDDRRRRAGDAALPRRRSLGQLLNRSSPRRRKNSCVPAQWLYVTPVQFSHVPVAVCRSVGIRTRGRTAAWESL